MSRRWAAGSLSPRSACSVISCVAYKPASIRFASSTSSSALSSATLPICLRYARTESADAVSSASLRAWRNASDSSSSQTKSPEALSFSEGSAISSSSAAGLPFAAGAAAGSSAPSSATASMSASSPSAASTSTTSSRSSRLRSSASISRSSPGSTSRSGSASISSTSAWAPSASSASGPASVSSGAAFDAAFAPRADGAFATAPLAEERVFFGVSLGAASSCARVDLVVRGSALAARFAGAAPLAAFAGDRLAGDDGDFVAVRFTGSSVAGLALVAATYTPSVGRTFGGFGHGQPKVSAMSNVGVGDQRECSHAFSRAVAEHHCNDSARSYRPTGQNSVRHIRSRSHRSAHDTGGVLQGGGHHRGAIFEQRHPFVGLAADAATGDEQIRPDRVFDGHQHPCDLLGPLFVAPVVPLFDRRRRSLLGLLAADLEMAELGVGYKRPVVDDRGPDPGAERQQHHQARLFPARAVAFLGEPGRVGIVEDRDVLAVQLGADDLARVGPDPGLVDVGRRMDDAVGDDAGVGHPQGAGPSKSGDDLGDGLGDRRRRRRLRGQHLDAFADQQPGVHVDDAALDAAAADVDAEPSTLRLAGDRAGWRIRGRVGAGHRNSSARLGLSAHLSPTTTPVGGSAEPWRL